MTSKLRTAALVLLGSAALEPRMAPAPQVQPAEPVICITNDLVQVDVVVTDSKGNRVTDLRPEDFEIQEDGKRQAITRFSFVGPPMQRTLVLVFDDSDSTGAIFEPVRSSLTHLVTQWVQPGDLVSVLRTGEGTGEWQQLTSDRQRLYQAIGRDNRAERLQVYGPPPQIQERAKLGGNALRWGDRQPLLVGVASLQALSSAVDGLAAMPGRKSLVLASALLGWTEFSEKTVAIRQLADRASRGGVVLHVLDLSETEVVNASLGASHRTSIQAARNDDVGKRPPNIAPAANRPWELRDSGADYLARATGGLSPSFKNDVRDSDRQQRTQRMLESATAFLEKGLDEIVSDSNGYYLIGYRPPQASLQAGDSKLHSIKVSVRRGGLKVRSRNGYYGKPDNSVQTEPKTRDELLQAALRSPFHGTGMRVRMTPFTLAAEKDPRSGRRRPKIRAMLAIDARDLRFQDQADGTRTVAVDVLGAVYGAEHQPVAASSTACTMRAPAKQLGDLESRNLLCTLDMTIDKPGPYVVRVAAMDQASDKVGSAYALAEVPNFDDGVNLSTLALAAVFQERVESEIKYERVQSTVSYDALSVAPASAAPSEQAETAPRLAPMAGNPVERVFAPGATIAYSSYVFGAGLARDTRMPKLEAQVYLYSYPRRQTGFNFLSPPVPVRVEEASQPVFVRGRIHLPEDLPPGTYGVSLELVDRSSLPDPRIGFKGGSASMDFVVAKPGASPATP